MQGICIIVSIQFWSNTHELNNSYSSSRFSQYLLVSNMLRCIASDPLYISVARSSLTPPCLLDIFYLWRTKKMAYLRTEKKKKKNLNSVGLVGLRALHHPFPRTICTLPCFARVKRPRWRPDELETTIDIYDLKEKQGTVNSLRTKVRHCS